MVSIENMLALGLALAVLTVLAGFSIEVLETITDYVRDLLRR